MSPQPPCLWCRTTGYKADLEHIVPEALGCPPWLVLTDGVCKACNNGLGHIDQALVRQFEMMAFMAGVPRKKGRKPSVDGWGSIAARHGPNGPLIQFNAGPDDWVIGPKRLKPASRATGVVSHAFEAHGAAATASFALAFGDDPKFARALYKLGLGLVAAREGIYAALEARYDPVRRFVRHGNGSFRFLVMQGDDPAAHAFWPFWRGPQGEGPVIPLALFGIEMTLDLQAGQPCLQQLEHQLASQAEMSWWKSPDSRGGG